MISSEIRTRSWRYVALGIATNLFGYAAFLVLLWLHVSAVAANAICYAIGVVLSYTGNRYWTFRSSNRHSSDLLRFAGAYGLGLACSVGSIALLIRFLPAPIAQLVTMGPTAITIFLALQLLRFGQPARSSAEDGPSCG